MINPNELHDLLSRLRRGEVPVEEVHACLMERLKAQPFEDLDFEEFFRIVDARRGLEQPVDDVHLVVERQLNGDRGQGALQAGGGPGALSLFVMYAYTR